MARSVKVKSPSQRARVQARIERESRERRKRLMLLVGAAALVAVVALVGIGALARDDSVATIPADINREGRTLGDPAALVSLVAWEDFQCPFCRQANDTAVAQVIDDYVKDGRVKVEYRHFAFLGDESVAASEASECANEQGKFWEYHDILFANQEGENRGAFAESRLKQMATRVGLDRAAFDSCLDTGKYTSAIKAETSAGRQLGVDSTPVFFVNGERIQGAQSYSVFKSAIDRALAAQ